MALIAKNRGLKTYEHNENTLHKDLEVEVKKLFDLEIECYRTTEVIKMELFRDFEWKLTTDFEYAKKSKIDYKTLEEFMLKYEPEISDDDISAIWRRFFHLNRRKYSEEGVFFNRFNEYIVPMDYFE